MIIPGSLVLKHAEWPDQDRLLWDAGLVPGNILDGERYAAGLRPTTLRGAVRGYGRWLAILARHAPTCLALHPADRVTPARARLFLTMLRRSGNTNNSIKARFWQLRSALKVMVPDRDFAWLTKPSNRTLHRLLPTELRLRRLLDVRELTRWGEDLMNAGLRSNADMRGEWYRNGLLVGMLSARAPRQRSMASLRLGHNISRREDHYYIAFRREDTKADRGLGYPLPDELTPRIDHYLEVVRPQLLNGRVHDWFWVNRSGERLADIGIGSVIRRGSVARFGFAIGTHAFRHAFATTGIIALPSTPGAVSAVLGNLPYVVQHHYDLGGQVEAARRWQSVVDSLLQV